MLPGKKKDEEKDQEQKVQNKGINLDDYAGDAEDDKAVRRQSNQYRKDLEGKEGLDKDELSAE
jgi:hypothetical protein